MPPLPDYDHALARALEAVEPLGAELCPFKSVFGRVLAEDVRADRDLPPFDRAAMDGYALRAADLARFETFDVIETVAAGQGVEQVRLERGQAVKIATGAPLPAGVDLVIPHELSDRGQPVRFSRRDFEPGENIHPRGADAKRHKPVIRAGTRVGAQHVGILAAVGYVEAKVWHQPRVAILTTGDEVVPPGEAVEPHQIRNSNQPMLRHALEAMGAKVVRAEHLRDDPDATRATVERLAHGCDVIVSAGGISAGERDFLPGAFEALGSETIVNGASIQPGRPIKVWRMAFPSGHRCVAIGLPGNPVSVLATAHLFAWPMLLKMSGLSGALAWRRATLAEPVRPNPTRQAFRPSRRFRDGRVQVLAWHGSGDLVHTAAADGLTRLPVQAEEAPLGLDVAFLPWAWGLW